MAGIHRPIFAGSAVATCAFDGGASSLPISRHIAFASAPTSGILISPLRRRPAPRGPRHVAAGPALSPDPGERHL